MMALPPKVSMTYIPSGKVIVAIAIANLTLNTIETISSKYIRTTQQEIIQSANRCPDESKPTGTGRERPRALE